MFRACHAFLFVHRYLVITCCERANLLALLFVMFSCVFVTFPCGVLGQVWYFIESMPDLCLLLYFFFGKKQLKNPLAGFMQPGQKLLDWFLWYTVGPFKATEALTET